MTDNHDVVVHEMTISHTEFFRTLPAAMGTIPFSVAGNEISADWSGGNLKITLSEEGRRNFGPIPLPVTHVEIRFDGFGDSERLAFLKRFDSYYRRGGG